MAGYAQGASPYMRQAQPQVSSAMMSYNASNGYPSRAVAQPQISSQGRVPFANSGVSPGQPRMISSNGLSASRTSTMQPKIGGLASPGVPGPTYAAAQPFQKAFSDKAPTKVLSARPSVSGVPSSVVVRSESAPRVNGATQPVVQVEVGATESKKLKKAVGFGVRQSIDTTTGAVSQGQRVSLVQMQQNVPIDGSSSQQFFAHRNSAVSGSISGPAGEAVQTLISGGCRYSMARVSEVWQDPFIDDAQRAACERLAQKRILRVRKH